MSVLLTWENPPDVVTGGWRTAELWRSLVQDAPMVLLQPDVVWGVAEDPEVDYTSAVYEVRYTTAAGSGSLAIRDLDIKRYKKPATICEITGSFIRPDGSPDACRVVEILDGERAGAFSRRLCTNYAGELRAFFMPGTRLHVRVDGQLKALDLCVPDKRTLAWDELPAHGTWVDADRRGWY